MRVFTEGDLDDVVSTHVSAFPGFLMTLLGPAFLREYYRLVVDSPGGLLLVAECEGRVRGFAAGSMTPAQMYRQLKERKLALLRASAIHLALRPRLWPRVMENLKVSGERSAPTLNSEAYAELASIAVSPNLRGLGVGRLLLANFIEVAAAAGAAGVELTTDARDNDSVNRLYVAAGFGLVSSFQRRGNRAMNAYRISFNKSPAHSAPN